MSVQKGQFKIPDGNGGVKVCQFETSADMVEGLDEIDSFQTKYNTLSEKIDEMKTAMLDSIAEVEHNSQVRYQTALQQIESAESGISETAQSRYEAMAARVAELEDKIDEAGIIVAQTRYTVPTIADVFTYNGQVQTPVLQNFRENIMTIITDSSVTSATKAGDYAITVRLADGKMWEGDTTEDKIIGWAIGKAVAAVPTIEENNFTYDGTAKRPTIKNFRENIMTIVTDSSVTSATNAGDYSIEIQLDDPDNYTWTDGTTENKTLAWKNQKETVTIPTLSGTFTYNGQEQKPAITNFRDDVSSILTDTSVLAATDAGNYNINVKLDDPDNYTWTDGTTENKTLAWQVAKAESSLSLSANSGSVTYSDTSTFSVVSQTGDGELSVKSANTNYVTATISDTTITLTGVKGNSNATVITVTKAETTNYQSATATYSCTVSRLPGTIEISGTSDSWYDANTKTLTLTDAHNSHTFAFNALSGGSLSVTGNTSYLNFNTNWHNLTITARGYAFDVPVSVRITCNEDSYYSAASMDITVLLKIRQPISPPTFIGNLDYTGESQSVVNDSYWKASNESYPYPSGYGATSLFNFVSGSSGADVASYTAGVKLKDATRFRWSNSSYNDYTTVNCDWSIANPYVATLYYTTDPNASQSQCTKIIAGKIIAVKFNSTSYTYLKMWVPNTGAFKNISIVDKGTTQSGWASTGTGEAVSGTGFPHNWLYSSAVDSSNGLLCRTFAFGVTHNGDESRAYTWNYKVAPLVNNNAANCHFMYTYSAETLNFTIRIDP